MKKYIPYLVIFLIGALIGSWLCDVFHSREVVQDVQRDTIRIKVAESYGHLDLKGKTYVLNVPKFDIPNFYYFPYDSTKIEYRDSIKYIVLPSESYHTKVDGIDIWHHGVRSEIDSVRAEYYRDQIKETHRIKDWEHTLSLYGNAGYMNGLRLPVGVQYLYHPRRWFGVGGKVEHDFALKQTGVYGTLALTFGW